MSNSAGLRKNLFVISRLEKAFLAILIALSCWGIFIWAVEPFCWRTLDWLRTINKEAESLIPAGVFLLLGLLFLGARRLYGRLKGWRAWRSLVLADVIVLSLLAFFVVTAQHDRSLLSRAAFGVALLLGIILAVRLTTLSTEKPTASASLFDETLGSSGFSPLEDFSEDKLERGPLLRSLIGLVTANRKASITFGIEGAWGSGKTSLLNALREELVLLHYPVVSFSLWDYREPDRIVRGYFDQLENCLGDLIALPGLRRKLYGLAAGLADLRGGVVAELTGRLLGGSITSSVDTLKRELEDALKELPRPVIVLMDDLDRLDADELRVVLRTLRLAGDLPNITHVLAYDREQVAKALFPEDEDGSRARDYLGKILHIELSIGNPPMELATRLLENGLGPLFTKIGDVAAKEFVSELQKEPLDQLIEALPTPREIRKVAAASAWHWQSMERHLNLFDVFILTIIHYRFPIVYRTMRAHPEWFTAITWGGNPWIIALKESWETQRGEYFKKLADSTNHGDRIALNLLKRLLPGIVESGFRSQLPREEDARRERRLIHPDIYHRYFHLYIPATSVSEAEMEDFVSHILGLSDSSARQRAIEIRFQEENNRGRLESFMKQWQLAIAARKPLGAQIAKDLASGIARAADSLSDESSFLVMSDLSASVGLALQLAGLVQDDNASTVVLVDVIDNTARLYFAAQVCRYSVKESIQASLMHGRKPDVATVQGAFMRQVEDRFGGTVGSLLSASQEDIAAVFQAANPERRRELILRDLEAEPNRLPALLRLGVPSRQLEDEREIDVFELGGFKDALPLERIHDLTRNISLDEWSNNKDRWLVREFRRRIQADQKAGLDGGEA